jgi:hypothetical protein
VNFALTAFSEVATREHRSAFARRRDDAYSSPIWSILAKTGAHTWS